MALTINTNIINDADQYLLDAKNVKGTYVVVNDYSELANLPSATVVNGSLAYCVNSYTDTNVNPNVTYNAGFYQRTSNAWNAADLGGKQVEIIEYNTHNQDTGGAYTYIKNLIDNGVTPIIVSSGYYYTLSLSYTNNLFFVNTSYVGSVPLTNSSLQVNATMQFILVRNNQTTPWSQSGTILVENTAWKMSNISSAEATGSNKNKLYPTIGAVYEFVNSSINNIAAYYITRNAAGDSFETYAQLAAASTFYNGGTTRIPTQNDYTIVLQDENQAEPTTGYTAFSSVDQYVNKYVIGANSSDATTYLLLVKVTTVNKNSLGIVAGTTKCWDEEPKATSRYIFQGEYNNGGQWEFQYVINNSGLTQAQLNAINSGITSEKVSQYDGYASSKQNVIDGSNKLLSDYVDDTSQTNKFVTQAMYDYLDNQLYQAPAISSFGLYYEGRIVNGTNEIGITKTINQIRHYETNIANISSLIFNGENITPSDVNNTVFSTLDEYIGYAVSYQNALTIVTESNKNDLGIVPGATPANTLVVLATPITISTSTTFTLSGRNTKNATFSKTARIEFNYYEYTCVSSSTTTPTTGLTKRTVTGSTTGYDISYVTGDYIYFYHTSSGKHVQQYSLGQWNNVPQTDLGTVTITKANGTTGTYYAYRVGAFVSGGTDKFRIA